MAQEKKFRVREATREDVDDLVRLAKELAVYEREPDAVVPNAADLYRRNLFDEHQYAKALLACDAETGKAIGMALYFFQFSTWTAKPTLYLEDLYVTPDRRNDGIGKALFAQLGRIARERDCARMQWWVINWNAPSIAFYKSLNAVPQDEWTTMRLEGDALAALEHLESRAPTRPRA